MLDLNIADNNIRQLLYVFRYFYSNAFKFNIMMHSDEWDLPDNIKNSDIIGMLKKDIRNLKYKYIPNNTEDKVKLTYTEDKIDNLLRLKFDDSNSLVMCFYIAYKTMKTLIESKQFLIAKWFIISFFEKYIPVVFKAYDVYSKGQSEIVLGIKYNLNGVYLKDLCNGLSELSKDIISDNISAANLNSKYYLLCKYILTINKDNGYVNSNILIYLYKMYLLYKDNPNKEAADILDYKYMSDDLDMNVYNIDTNISTKNNPIILDTTKRFTDSLDKGKLINIIRQTAKIIEDNEENKVNFNISEDFKMYFITSKDEFRPVFIKFDNLTYTIIDYNDNLYLLYMNDSKNIYGVSLVNWFDEPNSIVKIEPDSNGEFEFTVDDIEFDIE